MEQSNNTVIAFGVTAAVILVSFIIYKMGCATSNTNNAQKDKGKKEAKKEADKPKYRGGKISIFFGSQTGTAEGFARTLMEEGRSAGFDTKVEDLEDFEPEAMISTERAIFLMATYGEGEPTDNAASFTKWLKNEDGELSSTLLQKMQFTVFGLGNRQYEHYNRMGKLTNANLVKLGAQHLYVYGEGDDDATLEEDFEAWKGGLWTELTKKLMPQQGGDEGSVRAATEAVPLSKVTLLFEAVEVPKANGSTRKINQVRPEEGTNLSVKSQGKVHASTKHFFTAPRAKVLENRELRNTKNSGMTPEEVGSTRHIEIDLNNTGIDYHTADNLAILPENDPTHVKQLAAALNYPLDMTFDLKPVDSAEEFKLLFPTPCSVEDLLTLYIDIQGHVRFQTLKQLLPYVTDEQQTRWLEGMLEKDNRAACKTFLDSNCKGLLSLLTGELSSCKIPLSDFLHIASFIQPRYYTISSSSSCFPKTVHITVSITEFPLPAGVPEKKGKFTGLCSAYLRDMVTDGKTNYPYSKINGGSYCRVFVRASSFRLPKDLKTPIVMIGPGTGLAPMRALLQEREFLFNKAGGKEGSMGDNILFFGCKKKKMDFIYQEELQEYDRKNVLTQFHTAFSRDSKEKVYVQHLMLQTDVARNLLDLLLKRDAYVFVCGATAMGSDVHDALQQVLQQRTEGSVKANTSEKVMSKTQAADFLKGLQESGRYVQELWTA